MSKPPLKRRTTRPRRTTSIYGAPLASPPAPVPSSPSLPPSPLPPPTPASSLTVKTLRTFLANVPSKSIKLILAHLLIEPVEGGAVIRTTNLEIASRLFVPGLTVPRPFLLPIGTIAGALKNFAPTDPVTISRFIEEEGKAPSVVFEIGGIEITFSFDPEEPSQFPTDADLVPWQFLADLPLKPFQDALKVVSICAARDRTRYAFNSISLEPRDLSILRVQASNGKMLGFDLVEGSVNSTLPEAKMLLIPTDAADRVTKMTGDRVTLSVFIVEPKNEKRAAHSLRFTSGDHSISTRLIEGGYPNLDALYHPDQLVERAAFPCEDFIDAVKKILPAVPPEYPSVKVRPDMKVGIDLSVAHNEGVTMTVPIRGSVQIADFPEYVKINVPFLLVIEKFFAKNALVRLLSHKPDANDSALSICDTPWYFRSDFSDRVLIMMPVSLRDKVERPWVRMTSAGPEIEPLKESEPEPTLEEEYRKTVPEGVLDSSTPDPDRKVAHDRASIEAAATGCICSDSKAPVTSLCLHLSKDGVTSCTRQDGHKGLHVACAGSEGPHAISSWGTTSQLEETMADPPLYEGARFVGGADPSKGLKLEVPTR